ncbi:hypothetical protein ACFX58_19550 [Sphingomonas sp. NCPPB 2930]
MEEYNNIIQNLLEEIESQIDADTDHGEHEMSYPEPLMQIATLEKGTFKSLSPMLKQRFDFCSHWSNVNLSQDWLSLREIKGYEKNETLKQWVDLRIENWDHVPPASVGLEKCAIFSYNPYEPEEVYLVWTEKDEPEVWQYFGADYEKFSDLEEYLRSIVKQNRA